MQGSSCGDKQPARHHSYTTTIGRRHSCGGNNKGQSKIILVSMYFDRETPIKHDLVEIEAVMCHAKGTGY